jgi:cytochrome c peroxidase
LEFHQRQFCDIGLPSGDLGRGKFLVGIAKAQQAFKTPGWQESPRAPYMRDGSLLPEAVVELFA